MHLIALALAASVMAPAQAAPAEPGSLRLIDLTADYDRFATRTAGMPEAERIKAFEAEFAGKASGFYTRSRKPDRYDERVAKNLNAWPEKREKVLQVSREFEATFAPARVSFEKAFGKVRFDQPVYLLYSLGEMDGGTRKLDGKETLIFGADVIAMYHSPKSMRAFLHHELFHVYHGPVMAKCEQVWCSMWEEGLATYVATKLNPDAGDAALMMDVPAPIRPAIDKDRRAAFCAAAPLLPSEKDEDYASLFFGSSHMPGYPARAGYYLGYLVAEDMGRTRTLHQLAAMKGPQLEKQFMASYRRLSGSCAKGPAKA